MAGDTSDGSRQEHIDGKRNISHMVGGTQVSFRTSYEEKRGDGPVVVKVHREGRKAEAPLGGSRQVIDDRVARRVCEEFGFDASELPGPKSRV